MGQAFWLADMLLAWTPTGLDNQQAWLQHNGGQERE